MKPPLHQHVSSRLRDTLRGIMPVLLLPLTAAAAPPAGTALPDWQAVTHALTEVTAQAKANGGLFSPNRMWAAVVDRSGRVTVVTKTHGRDPWPGSRIIAMQKAYTPNAFSTKGLALSTANLFSPVQPGNSLFGLQFSNPINAESAYAGPAALFGDEHDPATSGRTRVGGINVFGGGLALYDQVTGEVIGALGVSGDTSCTDHVIAWRLRHTLGFERVPAGVNNGAHGGAEAPPNGDDNIIYDVHEDETGKLVSTSGYGHPRCGAKSGKVSGLPSMESF